MAALESGSLVSLTMRSKYEVGRKLVFKLGYQTIPLVFEYKQ